MRKRKEVIINSVVELGGIHRKSAIRLLNKRHKRPHKVGRKQGRSKYTPHIKRLIHAAWELAGEICAERLHPVLREYIEVLLVEGKVAGYSQEEICIAKTTSLGSLKLILSTFPHTRHFHSSHHLQSNHLYKQIPISVDFGKHTNPGYLEVDFVEHCGSSAAGRFCCSICLSDVAIGWTTHAASLGKDRGSLTISLKQAKKRIYHRIYAYHPDNNMPLLASLFDPTKNLYDLSRSRPYHKNDNAHVEQKNGDHIRGWVGYHRYDTQAQCDLLNQLYLVLDLYLNFFIPSQKLEQTIKDERGKSIRKIYDQAKTPYQRLLDASIPNHQKTNLRKIKRSLSLIHLKNTIDTIQTSLYHSLR